MKKLLPLLLLLATTGLNAQITITNATFPVIGDTLRYAVDATPGNIVADAPGGPYTWDYSGLTPETKFKIAYRPASAGSAFANFPGATMFAFEANGQNEVYYKSTATAVQNLGFKGSISLGGQSVSSIFRKSPPEAERRAPLSFFDVYSFTSNTNVSFPVEGTIAALLQQFGLPAGLIDSLRYRNTINGLEVADAFGNMTIPGGTYDVLRQKRVEYTSIALDLHLTAPFPTWLDISTFISSFPDIGTDTVTYYRYFSNTTKEIIANVRTGNDGLSAQSITFKDNIVSAVSFTPGEKPEISVQPNPARGKASFALRYFPEGAYTIRLYNTGGVLVRTESVTANGGDVSLEGLPGGVYLYTIGNAVGTVMGTGKLMLVE